jgi:Domain of unknown function (DUF4126)
VKISLIKIYPFYNHHRHKLTRTILTDFDHRFLVLKPGIGSCQISKMVEFSLRDVAILTNLVYSDLSIGFISAHIEARLPGWHIRSPKPVLNSYNDHFVAAKKFMIGILAVLSVSAAAGMRIALPLLVIGLLQTDLWQQVPLLHRLQPQVVIAVLTAWTVLELVVSKQLWGQRLLQFVTLVFSPLVGAVMAMAVGRILKIPSPPIWTLGLMGGLFALILQLVKVGWFYRIKGLPTWAVLLEDILCVLLVLFAFKAPNSGGLIALLLLWLALRSAQSWYKWYKDGKKSVDTLDSE